MRLKRRRQVSVLLAVSMAAGCLTGCTSEPVNAAEEKPVSEDAGREEVEAAAQAAASLVRTHGSEEGKEETVYVIADADGAPRKTIVSAWLKNPEEAETIEDRSDLTDIENVKGDEEWTVKEDGELVWNAEGNDIYYQGNSKKALPVSVHVAYELDGKAVKPEELKGADGHLKITFTYTNHTASERVVNGKKVTLYQPFVMISGMLLDNEKASSVEVTNGKVINSGEQTMIAGMAMPGLKESLGLTGAKDAGGAPVDIDIPEEVIIEADVTDFSMLMTLTVADNHILTDLNLDGVDSFEELKDAMDQMTDASKGLVDGTRELYSGTEELKNGTGRLSDGADQLDTGAAGLQKGASAVDDGVRSLAEGASALDDGLGELKAQAAQLPEGIGALKDGVGTVKATLKSGDRSHPGIYEGAAAIADGSLGLSAALKSQDSSHPGIYEGARSIQNGAAAIAAGAVSGDPSNPGIYEAAQMVKDGLSTVPGTLNAGIGAAASGLAEAKSMNQAAEGALQNLMVNGGLTEEQAALVNGALQALGGSDSYIDGVSGGLAGVTVDLGQANAALDGILAGAQNISGGAAVIGQGAQDLASGAELLYTGTRQMSSAAESIQNGVDTMISGNDGNNLNAMMTGLTAMESGGRALVNGVDTLKDGSGALSGGTQALREGTKELKNGTAVLKDGTGELKSGTKELADGVTELINGAGELMDGMAEFDESGIQKLSALFKDDAEGFMNRLRALKDYAAEYDSFSGAGEEMPSAVRFVIRTGSIGE